MDSGDERSSGARKRRRAEQLFGENVSEDEVDFVTPERPNTKRPGGRLLNESMSDLAISQGLNPAGVALEMDRLTTTVSNNMLDGMLRSLEGYHDSGLNSSASSVRTPTRRRLQKNNAHSSDAGSAMEIDSADEREMVIHNPAPPLHEIEGFGRHNNQTAQQIEMDDFLQDLVNVVPPSLQNNDQSRSARGNNARNGDSDRYQPSRYAGSKGKNYRNGESTEDRRREPWQTDRVGVDVDQYNQFVAGQHDQLLLYDGDKIPMDEAMADLAYLHKVHSHWQKRLRRPEAGTPNEISLQENRNGHIVKNTCNAVFLLLIEIVREGNSELMVRGGILATHPDALPTDAAPTTVKNIARRLNASQTSDNADAEADARRLADDNQPISLNMIQTCVQAKKARLFEIWNKLINRTHANFEPRLRQLTNQYWGELAHWLDASLDLISAFYKIRFIDACAIGRMVAEFSSSEMEAIKKNERLKFKLFLSRKMSSLNFRRGPCKGYIYRQHFIDGVMPSNFWVRDKLITDFLIEIVSPINGPQIMEIHAFASDQIEGLARMVETGDPSLFPVVSPMRGLFGFRNGILDVNENQFFKIGTQAYNDGITNSLVYKYVYNFFDGQFNSEGFSEIDGHFDWTDRMAPFGVDGKANWSDPTSMPKNHWSRVLHVPILDDNIRIQKWDLHTIANMWFLFGRLLHTINDNMQCAPFLKGNPGTGKSTFLQFPILAIPDEFRAIIPANAQAVFGLAQLIGSDGTFVKHMGAVTDMNGKFDVPTSQLNVLVTGEHMTANQKHENTRTARADMPLVFAGNQFFNDGPLEMPSKLRRWVQFVLNTPPAGKGVAVLVNSDTIIKAMPAYLRMVNEVYHEFWRMKLTSPSDRIVNSTNIWDFVSPLLKAIQLEAMSQVSGSSRFVANYEWVQFTADEKDILSIDSLRYASDIFFAWDAGNRTASAIANRTHRIPKDTTVMDALGMVHPGATVEEWGSSNSRLRFADQPELLRNGLDCQLGDRITTLGQKYVIGIKIAPQYVDFLMEHLPKDITAASKALMPPPSHSAPPNAQHLFAKPSAAKRSARNRNPSPPNSQSQQSANRAGALRDMSALLADMQQDPDVE